MLFPGLIYGYNRQQVLESHSFVLKEHFNLKNKINIILPIILAAILPGLSLYSSIAREIDSNLGFFGSWAIGSIVFFVLWHLLWLAWEVSAKYRIWVILLIIVSLLGIMTIVIYLFFPENNDLILHLGIRMAVTSTVIMVVQYALKAQQNISHLLLEKEQMLTENYKVQLKALRTQIDPHFLFNSLNTLRSMVRQNHDNSEKFVMSLSDFYRHTLKHNDNTTLQLSEELAVLESYVFLMKSRNEEAISLNFNIEKSLYSLHLPTLALQVVVENCFKHNSMTSKMPLHIEIKSTDDNCIEIVNNIQPKIGDKDESGFGLDLLKKRYELMKVEDGIRITRTEDKFMVKLKLI